MRIPFCRTIGPGWIKPCDTGIRSNLRAARRAPILTLRCAGVRRAREAVPGVGAGDGQPEPARPPAAAAWARRSSARQQGGRGSAMNERRHSPRGRWASAAVPAPKGVRAGRIPIEPKRFPPRSSVRSGGPPRSPHPDRVRIASYPPPGQSQRPVMVFLFSLNLPLNAAGEPTYPPQIVTAPSSPTS